MIVCMYVCMYGGYKCVLPTSPLPLPPNHPSPPPFTVLTVFHLYFLISFTQFLLPVHPPSSFTQRSFLQRLLNFLPIHPPPVLFPSFHHYPFILLLCLPFLITLLLLLPLSTPPSPHRHILYPFFFFVSSSPHQLIFVLLSPPFTVQPLPSSPEAVHKTSLT